MSAASLHPEAASPTRPRASHARTCAHVRLSCTARRLHKGNSRIQMCPCSASLKVLPCLRGPPVLVLCVSACVCVRVHVRVPVQGVFEVLPCLRGPPVLVLCVSVCVCVCARMCVCACLCSESLKVLPCLRGPPVLVLCLYTFFVCTCACVCVKERGGRKKGDAMGGRVSGWAQGAGE